MSDIYLKLDEEPEFIWEPNEWPSRCWADNTPYKYVGAPDLRGIMIKVDGRWAQIPCKSVTIMNAHEFKTGIQQEMWDMFTNMLDMDDEDMKDCFGGDVSIGDVMKFWKPEDALKYYKDYAAEIHRLTEERRKYLDALEKFEETAEKFREKGWKIEVTCKEPEVLK